MKDTREIAYTERLLRKSEPLWKTILDVQAPYRFNLRRLKLGYVLDVGCGIGRNLKNLNGHAVGVDHNSHSVAEALKNGFDAFLPEEFKVKFVGQRCFDSILISHVLEHLDRADGVGLIKEYLPYLKPGGQLVMITPQEAGYKSDPTHVKYLNFSGLRDLATEAGLKVVQSYSFPFPAIFGKIFLHNEHVVVAVLAE
jgi:2-polyprenyl-3-methyl-5-hydroxy-6-metoxy-1,4-benzoquinol methylase